MCFFFLSPQTYMPKKEIADESDTVPQTYYIKLEPTPSHDDFVGKIILFSRESHGEFK